MLRNEGPVSSVGAKWRRDFLAISHVCRGNGVTRVTSCPPFFFSGSHLSFLAFSVSNLAHDDFLENSGAALLWLIVEKACSEFVLISQLV